MSKAKEKEALNDTVKNEGDRNQDFNNTRTANNAYADSDPYVGYKQFSQTGGVDPEAKARLLGTARETINAGGSGGGGGGSSSGGGGGARHDYFSDIGPLDSHVYDEAESAFKNIDQSGAKKFADTGGVDDAAMERMQGMGGYDEFAKTGGYTDEDKSNIRAKSLSPISAFDTARRDDMSTRRSVQGGYTPGFDASSRALSKDTAKNIADTSLDTELGIKDKVNAGRQWGISGVANSAQAANQLKTQNQLEGTRLTAQIQEAVASGQMSAADGRARIAQVQQQTDLAIASGRTQRDIAEMQVAAANGNAAAARELARVEMDAQNQRFVMQLEQSGKLAGLGGMNDIYGNAMNRGLATDTQQSNSNLGFGSLRSGQADMIGGPMDAIKNGFQLAAPVVGAFTGGGGGGGGQGMWGSSPRSPQVYDNGRLGI